ncbi:MAG: hypothetical protein QHH43_08725 [Candidatus Saccharicenans sp.]|jgi:hypothetical protein|nr:hypothetical protein [Candidatus Saccharicenans sp.]MDH7575824.1 hypothetical protein [Candidatus Saccharicenans sp.]
MLTLEEAKEIIDIFLNDPTEANFKIVQETIYPFLSVVDQESTPFQDKLFSYVLTREPFWIFEYEIFAGNRLMALFARRLLDVSDGAYASMLFKLFGKLSRLNPELFLTMFKDDIKKPVLELAVTESIFLEGTEKYQRYDRYDLIQRIKALRTVTNPELRNIRDYCILLLERELKENGLYQMGYSRK